MGAALVLAERARPSSCPNPNVGCVVVVEARVVGRGWTQSGGRPHAEANALDDAGDKSRGATLYVTLEPCAHVSARGPACVDRVIASGASRVVIGMVDRDPRTAGAGIARLRDAGISVAVGIREAECASAMAGFVTRQRFGRPHVTLKLALSIDGAAAMGSGASQWITGAAARGHAHLVRARSNAILVGRGTWEYDAPKLDVRLPGLEPRSPSVTLLSGSREAAKPRSEADPSRLRAFACTIATPSAIGGLKADWLLVEGGMTTAASFLREDLVDTLLIYRAPVVIGGGRTLSDIGVGELASSHGRWRVADTRRLGSDRLDVYERVRD